MCKISSSMESMSSSSCSTSYTINWALAISICFFTFICSNSSFLCASLFSVLAVSTLSCTSIFDVSSLYFTSSCRALNSACFAAFCAATSAFFKSMEVSLEDLLALDLVDTLLKTDPLSSLLRDHSFLKDCRSI